MRFISRFLLSNTRLDAPHAFFDHTGNILHHLKIRAIVTTTVCSCETPNCKFIHKLADLSEEKGQPWLPVHQ